MLSALGNAGLLPGLCIGICGSRAATASAVRHARQFGYLGAQQGFVVVSGYARGVDVAAHVGALEAGGSTIAVLAEGIEYFRIRRELRPRLDEGNFVAVSPFATTAKWTAWRAMDRNRYIVGLSRGLFVIESREKGGTFEAGLECLRQKKPLWVIDYERGGPEREGNRRLIAAGGIPIRNERALKKVLRDAREAFVPRQERLTLRVAEG